MRATRSCAESEKTHSAGGRGPHVLAGLACTSDKPEFHKVTAAIRLAESPEHGQKLFGGGRATGYSSQEEQLWPGRAVEAGCRGRWIIGWQRAAAKGEMRTDACRSSADAGLAAGQGAPC